jgi:protein-tyrosine phosphatase
VIDLHSHVLPGLDDGARNPEESLAMLRMAAASGVTDLVATPHASDRYPFDPALVEQKLDELTRSAADSPRLHYGCEMHLTPENIDRAAACPAAYSIGHRGYLLVELSDFQIPRNAADLFGALMNAGLRPIVAHPERNPLLQSDYRRLRAWVEMGCLLQVTAQSFLGRFGDRALVSAGELVKRGLAHLAASDAHDTEHRPPLLDQARLRVELQYGADAADRLFSRNPEAVLHGRPLPDAPVERRWWSRLLQGRP